MAALLESPASLSVEPPVPAVPAVPTPMPSPAPWRFGTRLAFRVAVIYFGLYVLSTQMLGSMFPLPISVPQPGVLPPLRNLTEWTALYLLRAPAPILSGATGSGDKMFDFAQVCCFLLLAVIGAIVWSWLARARPRHAGVQKWFRLFLRISLGATMASYGMVKAIPLQMPAPGLTRLLEPYGNFSPMGVLWAQIGASRGYEIFAGTAELTAAVLLFIPGITTFGSLVCLAVITQVFVLNMTYDVPVKLFSFHLMLMSLTLLAPDMQRLVDVFLRRRAIAPFREPPLVQGRRALRILILAQLVYAAYVLGMSAYQGAQGWKTFGGGAPKSALYGIWNVEEMAIDGHTRAPLVIDYDRWRRVIFQSPAAMAFQRMDDSFERYSTKIDTSAHIVALEKPDDKAWKASLAFARPAPDRLVLDGKLNGHAVHMALRLVDHKAFLLESRGFHWIQERPFNR
jgi:hypothetical protein